MRQTKKGIPIVEWGTTKDGKKKTSEEILDIDEGETIEEYVVEKILRYTDKKENKVVVQWKGYTDTTIEPVRQIEDTKPYGDFLNSLSSSSKSKKNNKNKG